MNSGESKVEGGDPGEVTAVTAPPKRPSEGKDVVTIIFGFVLGVAVVCLASLAITCAMKPHDKPGHRTGKNAWARLAQAEVSVAALQGQMATTMARTGVVEARTNGLEATVNALPDKLAEQFGEKLAEKADRTELELKADKTELKNYARTKRMAKVERKLDDYISSAEEATALPTRKITIRHTPTYVDVYRSRKP